MTKSFKVDGYSIPISFDKNQDGKLQKTELNIWCKENDMKYSDGKIITCIPYDAENVPLKFNEKKYSIENLKKRYPEDKFEIINRNNTIMVVFKETQNPVLAIYRYSKAGAVLHFFGNDNSLSCIYDDSGKLIQSKSYINGQKKSHSPLTKKLYQDVSAKNSWGLPTTGKNIGNHIYSINPGNVETILNEYQSKYGTSLISDIFSEIGLDAEERANYAKHIVDVLCKRPIKDSNINQIKTKLYKYIEHERDKTGMMSSTNIDKLINVILSNYYPTKDSLIAYDIGEDISAKNKIGLPTTSNRLGKSVKSINSDNVESVMKEYRDQNNGKSLLSDIIEERGLSTDSRQTYLKRVINAYLAFAKKQGIYIDDLEQKFNNEITYQMDKFGFANADYLNIFIQQLQKRISALKLQKEGYMDLEITKPNGKIDESFYQGRTGDCWLLASIKAISNSPKGLKILNDSIKVNNNGSVTVTLKGVNKTYTITKEELENNIQLSSGDGDIRALELAVNKYIEEERGVNERLDINGNWVCVAFSILVGGKKIDDGLNNYFQVVFKGAKGVKPIDDNLINTFNDPNKITAVSAHGNIPDVQIKSEDRKQVLTTDHAYAVLRADSEYVYIVNPWKSDSEIKITREQFKEFFNYYNQMEL